MVFKNVYLRVMKKLLYWSILLAAESVWPTEAQPRGASKRMTHLYDYVQQYDPLSGQWRDMHARARLECDTTITRITLWNHWGHETINPVFRVWATAEPVFDTSSEQWKMSARMRRAKGSSVRDCTIESGEIIALVPNIEFSLRTSDNEARYRISKKPILEENEY